MCLYVSRKAAMDRKSLVQRSFHIITMNLVCNGEVRTEHFPNFISDEGGIYVPQDK